MLADCTASKVLRWCLRPHSPNSVGGHAQLQNESSTQVQCLPIGITKVKGNSSWHHGYNTIQQRLKLVLPTTTAFEEQHAEPLQSLTWYWSSSSRCHWATQRSTAWLEQCSKDNPLTDEQRLFMQHTTFQLLKLPYPTNHSFSSLIKEQGVTSATSGWFECNRHGTQRSTVINLVAGLRKGILQLNPEQFQLFPLPQRNLEWSWINNNLEGTVNGQRTYQITRFRNARPLRIQDTTTADWSHHWPKQSPILQRICLPDDIARKIQEPGQRLKRAQYHLQHLARTQRHEKALLGRARTRNRHRVMLLELNIKPAPQSLPNLWHKAPGTSYLVWFAFRYQTLRLNTYVQGSQKCPEGCGASNSLYHTLWTCPSAQLVWKGTLSHWRGTTTKPKNWKNSILGGTSIPPPQRAYDQPQFLTLQRRHPDLVHTLLKQGWRLVVLVTQHYLWSRFNHHRYPNTPLVADLPAHIATTFDCLSRYQAHSKHYVSSAVLTILASCYHTNNIAPAPPKKQALMKFDGASQGNPGPGGSGAVLLVRTKGKLHPLAFTARHIAEETNTNNAAEYRALLDGLDLATVHGISHLHIVGDSALVVQQTKGLAKVTARLRQLAQQVQQKLTRFQAVTIRNVLREHNQAADFLSKLRTMGDAPLINHQISGWAAAPTLLHFLTVENHYPS